MALDPRPSKIVCVGRNYLGHAEELGNDVPDEPLLFFKPPSALIDAGEPIILPPQSSRVDYEGEIGLVMGRTIHWASEDEAWDAVAFVVPVNDVTARDLQAKDVQWSRAKGFDTFCPVGTPVPARDFDPRELEVITRVNGEVRQHGLSKNMAFSIPHIIAHASAVMTLERGDLIATGTPEGIAPLSAGDVVEIEIPGVGSVQNPVRGSERG